MSTITLSGLFVYPVKGARGISLDRAHATSLGLDLDRRFMITTPAGDFLSQREHSEMALIETSLEGDALTLNAPGLGPLKLPKRPEGQADKRVRVWGDTCRALSLGAEPAAYLSEYLKTQAELVYMTDDVIRPVDTRHAKKQERVSFADGFPYLLTSEGSLSDLNARLADGVPMDRFRSNLVVRGAPPWAEDAWTSVQIGNVVFHALKPCSRCKVISIDQSTGIQGKDPLATLSTFRARASKVYFGWNMVAEGEGEIRVGDTVSLLPLAYDRAV